MGGAGLNRIEGWGLRGKLSKSLRFEIWNTQIADGGASATDDNNYLLSVGWSTPGLKITPWLGWEKHNAATTGTTAISDTTTERDIWYYGLNVNAKFGKLKLNVTGVLEDGTFDFGRGVHSTGCQDTDIEGYAVLIRSWVDIGRGLKVGFYGVFMPGDDDVTSAVGDLGTQPDNKLKRFTPFHTRGSANDTLGSCRLDGPQLLTRRRYHTFAIGYAGENRCGNGDCGARMNGIQLYEFLFSYKVTKSFTLQGNYSLIRSAASRATIDNNANGIEDAGDTTFVDSKDAGSELDISAKYFLYKGFFAKMTYADLFASDYSKSDAVGTRDFDDTWALYWELRHTF